LKSVYSEILCFLLFTGARYQHRNTFRGAEIGGST
jgi:hypothetical protein